MTEIELSKRIAELPSNETAYAQAAAKALRRKRFVSRIHKDDWLLQITNFGGYAPHVGYVDWGFTGSTLLHSGQYMKYPRNSSCQRWMKRETSKRTRHAPDIPVKGNYYRRLFDYWWTLY